MPTLKNLVDEVVNIENEIIGCRDTLKQILIDKKIEGLENENKLSILVGNVNMLDPYNENKLWLYNEGDEYTETTGGWTENLKINPSFWTGGFSIGTKTSTTLNIKSNNDRHVQSFVPYNKINLTDYRTINIEFSSESRSGVSGNTALFIVSSLSATSYIAELTVQSTTENISKNREIKTLDISKINASYYLGISSLSIGFSTKIHKVWLKK